MARQATLAKPAHRPEAERVAWDIDFAGDSFPDPPLLHRRRNSARFLHFAYEFVSRCAAKIVVTAQNFQVGITNTRHAQTH
jgi:hypothetical protein